MIYAKNKMIAKLGLKGQESDLRWVRPDNVINTEFKGYETVKDKGAVVKVDNMVLMKKKKDSQVVKVKKQEKGKKRK